jgi:hypothetical protein
LIPRTIKHAGLLKNRKISLSIIAKKRGGRWDRLLPAQITDRQLCNGYVFEHGYTIGSNATTKQAESAQDDRISPPAEFACAKAREAEATTAKPDRLDKERKIVLNPNSSLV